MNMIMTGNYQTAMSYLNEWEAQGLHLEIVVFLEGAVGDVGCILELQNQQELVFECYISLLPVIIKLQPETCYGHNNYINAVHGILTFIAYVFLSYHNLVTVPRPSILVFV